MRKIIILLAFSFLFAQNSFSQRNGGPVCNDKATYLEKPSFATEDIQKKINGSVYVRIRIDKEGNVVSAEAQSGSPLLQKEAEEAALRSKFEKSHSPWTVIRWMGLQ